MRETFDFQITVDFSTADVYTDAAPWMNDEYLMGFVSGTEELTWTEKDGWWYYSGAVDTDGVTEPLMTGISFDGPNMTNEYQSCTLTVDVVAQAVQAANNNTSALEAMGWPET